MSSLLNDVHLNELLQGRLEAKTPSEIATSKEAIRGYFDRLTSEEKSLCYNELLELIDLVPNLKLDIVINKGYLCLMVIDGLRWVGFIDDAKRNELGSTLAKRLRDSTMPTAATADADYYAKVFARIDWSKAPKC